MKNKITLVKKVIIIALMLNFNTMAFSQSRTGTVLDQTNTIRKLSIRPYMAIGIVPMDLGDLYANLNIDAQYWLTDKLNLRAGWNAGTFNGVSLGGTFNIKNSVKNINQKFIISQTETEKKRTTTFYKAKANIIRTFGPSVDLKVGALKADYKGFYSEVLLGVDYQTFARNYLEFSESEYYPSNKNGWYSLKLQAIIATTGETTGFGFQGNFQAARMPWKGTTMYLAMPLGVMFGNEKITPIITPSFGISINLIKPKK